VPRNSAKSHNRSNEDAAGFALAHRTRVEILAALNEADRSESELVRLLHLPQSTVQYHLSELIKAGSVEVAATERVRGLERWTYRGIAMGDFLADEIGDWSFEKRQAFWAFVIQSAGAEELAALHAGTISREEKPWLGWARFNLDEQGVADAYDTLEDCWSRLRAIEAESDQRQAGDSENLRTFVYSLSGYPRSRPGRSSYPKPGA
jgi:DNA-binding transcriptional ArsR family regulator